MATENIDGVFRLHMDFKISQDEMAKWDSKRIKAFFDGIAQVEQASGMVQFVSRESIIMRLTLLEAETFLAAATNKGYVHPSKYSHQAFNRATKKIRDAIEAKRSFDREPKEKRNYS